MKKIFSDCIILSTVEHTGYVTNCSAPKTERTFIMQITDIKIRKFFDEGPMKAVVSVTLDDALAVHDIKVIYARERYFIVMPSRKNPDGSFRDIVHPINAQFRAELEQAVIDAYHVQLVATQAEENRDASDHTALAY